MKAIITIFCLLSISLPSFSANEEAQDVKVQWAGWLVKAKTFEAAVAEYAANCAKTADFNNGTMSGMSDIKVVRQNDNLMVIGNCIYNKKK